MNRQYTQARSGVPPNGVGVAWLFRVRATRYVTRDRERGELGVMGYEAFVASLVPAPDGLPGVTGYGGREVS